MKFYQRIMRSSGFIATFILSFLIFFLSPALIIKSLAQADSTRKDSISFPVIKPPVNLYDTLNYYQTKYDTSWYSGALSYVKFDSLVSKEYCKIDILEMGKRDSCILILGGIHGNELQGVDLAVSLINYCKKLSDTCFRYKLVIVPILNPDGIVHDTRTNANSIDINRNFATKNFGEGKNKKKRAYNCGTEPNSEIETQLVINLVNKYRPFLILTYHAPYACINYDGPTLDRAAKLSQMTGLKLKKDIGYKISGSMGIYFGTERNIAVITMELPGVDIPQWDRSKSGLLDLLQIKGK
jgi:murein peptide amidase A